MKSINTPDDRQATTTRSVRFSPFHPFTFSPALGIILALLCTAALAHAQDVPTPAPAPVTHRIMGLFNLEREEDLRLACEKLENIKLLSIDFKNAQATFLYDAAKAFPGAKAEKIIERFDSALRNVSHGTFGIKPPRVVPAEKLVAVEIPVIGLDCKGCCWAVYQTIHRIDGVDMTTVSFKTGLVMALFDSTKTNREALEAALKHRGVKLKE